MPTGITWGSFKRHQACVPLPNIAISSGWGAAFTLEFLKILKAEVTLKCSHVWEPLLQSLRVPAEARKLRTVAESVHTLQSMLLGTLDCLWPEPRLTPHTSWTHSTPPGITYGLFGHFCSLLSQALFLFQNSPLGGIIDSSGLSPHTP